MAMINQDRVAQEAEKLFSSTNQDYIDFLVKLWDEIHAFEDTPEGTGVKRQEAVVRVNRVIEQFVAAKLRAAYEENERLRQLLKRDHAGNCVALTQDASCSCGWNEGNYNADDELDKLQAELAQLRAQVEKATKRNAEHEMFRHQHRDCDKMGCENQQLRLKLADAERREREAVVRGMDKAIGICKANCQMDCDHNPHEPWCLNCHDAVAIRAAIEAEKGREDGK